MEAIKRILNIIFAPFIDNGKPKWNAILQGAICILLVLFNLPEGFGVDFPKWAVISTSTFNWLAGAYLFMVKYYDPLMKMLK